MTRGDIVGLVLSYVYAFSLLFAVETLGGRLRIPQTYSRKIIHVGAGLWTWGIVLLFDHWYLGVIPFATFIILNYLFYRKQSFEQMDTADSTPGTVYFAISITLLTALLWRTGEGPDRLPLAMAGIMAMTLGDGFAAIVGTAWGRKHFSVFGNNKSVPGSAGMLVFSWVGIWIALAVLPGSPLSPMSIPIRHPFSLSLAAAVLATTAEAVSPRGLDNLSVPLVTTGLLVLLL